MVQTRAASQELRNLISNDGTEIHQLEAPLLRTKHSKNTQKIARERHAGCGMDL
jgi:hypothetical protein